MKKDVILIYPEGRLIGNFPNQKGHKYTQTLPISLLPMAYVLANNGYNPVIIDARVEDYRIDISKAICVGISSMTGIQIANGLEIAKYIRHQNPILPVVWGGIHPTLFPIQTARHRLVDVVVRAEGERTLLDLVKCFENGEPIDNVMGITYEKDGNICHNPDQNFINLNELGYLPYHLLDFKKYDLSEGFPINTSRGCPYKCGFCYNQAFNKNKWRYQNSDLVVKQAELVTKNYNQNKFNFIVEDNFFVGKKRVEEICQKFVERKLNIEWSSFCRADYITNFDQDFLELLRKSGCKKLLIGGESGSNTILRKIEKGITNDDLIESARKCKEVGIIPVYSFILGFPFETSEDIRQTFDVIDELIKINRNSEVNGIFIYTPYPGTPLFINDVKEGIGEPESLEGWSKYQYSDPDNIPWFTPSKKEQLKVIFRISRFPFYSKIPMFPPLLKIKENISIFGFLYLQLKRLIYCFLWVSAKIRWKYKLFVLPIEWKLWDWYARKKRIW